MASFFTKLLLAARRAKAAISSFPESAFVPPSEPVPPAEPAADLGTWEEWEKQPPYTGLTAPPALPPEPPETHRPPPAPASEMEAFLSHGQWVSTPASSNVMAMMFNPDDEKVSIEFLNGAIYTYDSITPTEAARIYLGVNRPDHLGKGPGYLHNSRGGAVWDYLRLTGKNFTRTRAPLKSRLAWLKTEEGKARAERGGGGFTNEPPEV
jgi:hypothetical protein